MKKRGNGRRILKSLVTGITVAAMAAVTVLPGTLGSIAKAADEATDESVAKADKEALTVTNSEDVSGNLTLPETGENGSVIAWTSSDEAVISSKADGKIAAGKVTRQDADTDVTLTATITCGDAVEKKEIVCHVRAKAEIEETTDYLFAYFPYTGFKDERVYFGISRDGLNYEALNDGKYVLESKAGTHGIRDPFVFRSHEGDKFYMIATDLTVAGLTQDGVHYPGMGWNKNQTEGSQSIVVWESDDLANWSDARLCKVSLDTAGCTWAPEAYWDDETEQYVVFWASKVSDDNYAKQRVYYATTRDFHTFSEAKVWIEEKGSVIDTTVIKVGDYYYRYTKNEDGNTNVYGTPGKRIYCEKSKSLTAEKWDLVANNSLNISGGQIEGGCIFKINTDDAENAKNMAALKGAEMTNDDVYCLMADRTGATIFPGLSDDITKGWFHVLGTNSSAEADGTTLYSMPDPVASHGTVMPITAEEYDNLMMKYEESYVGKAALENTIKKALSETEKDKYTEESWNAYMKALADAKVVAEKEDATQEEVDDALKVLKVSKDALEEKPADIKLPYKDVAEDAWYYNAVVFNYVHQTMTGMKEDEFGPAGTLVRAQFASVLHKLNGKEVMEYTDVFSDVTEHDWFRDAVLWAASAKIVTGYTGTKLFGANDPVTRAQMATMMYRYAKDYKGYDVKADGDYSSFPDAGDVQDFAADALKWAVSEGIITGKTIDGKLLLDPQGSANRAECATIIQRFMEKYEK